MCLDARYWRAALQAPHQGVPYRMTTGESPAPVSPASGPASSGSSGRTGPCGPASALESPGGNCANAPVSNASRDMARARALPLASTSRRSTT